MESSGIAVRWSAFFGTVFTLHKNNASCSHREGLSVKWVRKTIEAMRCEPKNSIVGIYMIASVSVGNPIYLVIRY